MTYEEAMQFWFGRVNYEQKTPLVGDLKLDRMRQLLALLGNPHQRLRIVHIAGSKGKGSTSAMLASILQHEGYRVGLFTSPHLVAVEERIQVDREPISRWELTELMQEIRAGAPSSFLDEMTFFEIGTALGFLHFVRRRVDFAIVEVGLGGRFDSTNVCDPLLAIITSISFDHTQILGNTLAKIAFEKAGIVKPGRPTVSGVRAAEARQVIADVCRRRGSPLRQVDADYRYEHLPAEITARTEHGPRVRVSTWRRDWPTLDVGLIGEHQARNAALAIAAIEQLHELGVPMSDRAVTDGLARLAWPARLEMLLRQPLVLLDCAHNVASAQALAQALTTSFPLESGGRRLLIFGGNRDKDLVGMLEILAPLFDQLYLTNMQSTARGMPAVELAQLVPAGQRSACSICDDSADAWRRAVGASREIDLIAIAGSVFLAGELRPLILTWIHDHQ